MFQGPQGQKFKIAKSKSFILLHRLSSSFFHLRSFFIHFYLFILTPIFAIHLLLQSSRIVFDHYSSFLIIRRFLDSLIAPSTLFTPNYSFRLSLAQICDHGRLKHVRGKCLLVTEWESEAERALHSPH